MKVVSLTSDAYWTERDRSTTFASGTLLLETQ